MMKGRVSSQLETTASEMAPLPSEPKRRFGWFVEYVQEVSRLRGWDLLRRMCALALIAWIPSIAFAYVVHVLVPGASSPDIFENKLQFFLGGLVLAPLSETWAMRYVFRFLRKWLRHPVALSGVSALLWVVPHVFYIGWGVHAAWPFFVLGLCYLSLEPLSFGRAMWITGFIHAGCNALSYALYVATAHFGTS